MSWVLFLGSTDLSQMWSLTFRIHTLIGDVKAKRIHTYVHPEKSEKITKTGWGEGLDRRTLWFVGYDQRLEEDHGMRAWNRRKTVSADGLELWRPHRLWTRMKDFEYQRFSVPESSFTRSSQALFLVMLRAVFGGHVL